MRSRVSAFLEGRIRAADSFALCGRLLSHTLRLYILDIIYDKRQSILQNKSPPTSS